MGFDHILNASLIIYSKELTPKQLPSDCCNHTRSDRYSRRTAIVVGPL
jgi:hypothetical protein